MSPWWWVLIGVAVWLAPAVVAGLMLGWTLLRHRDKPARHRRRPKDEQPPSGT
jgi:hypothetical protein